MIRGFTGRNGSGKTAALIAQMAIPSWRIGRKVVANLQLYPEHLGYPRELFQPLRSWHEIPRLGRWVDGDGRPRMASDGSLWSITGNEGCTLLLDEITSVLPSRDAVNVPPELQRMLNQFRKPDVWVGWTAPAWARADLMLREVTMDVTEAGPFLPSLLSTPNTLQKFTDRLRGGRKQRAVTLWTQHKAFRWVTYDAFDYEEADRTGRWDMLRPIQTRRLISPAKRNAIFAAYNTLEGVQLLDHIQCAECGGKFARRACKCPVRHDDRPKLLEPHVVPDGWLDELESELAVVE